jgi:hypothetical protein
MPLRLRFIAGPLVAAATLVHATCSERPSAPIAPSTQCNFSVSVNTSKFGPQGGTATASVTTGSSCVWSAASAADWITVDGASRTGEGSVPFTIRSFDNTTERSGAITIAQQNFTLTQSGCIVRLASAELSFTGDGGSSDVAVEASDGCRWLVEGTPSWATFDPSSGAGSASIRVRAARNTSTTSTRDAAVQIGAQALTLRQSEVTEPPPGPAPLPQPACAFSVSPVEAYVPSAGGRGSVTVSTAPGCAWTASASLPHLRITLGTSGTGPGRVDYEVDANPDSYVVDFRRAAIEIRWNAPTAGQNVWLSQFGDCRTVVSRAITFSAEGGEHRQNLLVESPFQCPWRVEGGAGAAWLTVVSPPIGRIVRGDATLLLTAEPNTSSQPRTTILIVGERQVTVTQAGR